MGLIPVAFSLLASFVSPTAFIGMPAEVYQYGIQFWISLFGILVTPLIGAFITGPFFAKLQIFSVFEYLELRYQSKKVRLVGACAYILKAFITSSIYMYGPATALSALTGLDQNISIALIGFIATFYTSLGGIRGVIWADVYQATIMFSSLLMIFIKGVYDVGGFDNLFRINSEGGRLNFFDFNPDPFIRQSFWSLIIGQIVFNILPYGLDQLMIQRFKAAKSKKFAQAALLLNIPGLFIVVTMCHIIGLILYALYAKCDPLTSPVDPVKNVNQLVGYFVMQSLSMYPGLPGLFLASLFCGSLSSLSSFLGSQSALVWQDLFKHFAYFKNMNDRQSLIVNKIIVLVCGTIATCLAFFIASLGGNLVQINSSLNGAFAAPIIGLFLLSFFFPFINVFGAITATIAGFASVLWLSIGAMIVKPTYPKLPVSTESCLSDSFTTIQEYFTSTVITTAKPPLEGFDKFYSLSYMLYSTFGVLSTIIFGVLASLISRGYKIVPNEKYLILNLFGFLPKYKRNKIDEFDLK